MMICDRCGSRCPPDKSGFCFHCRIAVDLEKVLGKSLAEKGIGEGFPDWVKPYKSDKSIKEMLL